MTGPNTGDVLQCVEASMRKLSCPRRTGVRASTMAVVGADHDEPPIR
jgi:hypothetical protein